MRFSQAALFKKRPSSDLLIIPLMKGKNKIIWPPQLKSGTGFAKPIQLGDFKASEGDAVLQYPPEGIDKRVLLLGLGDSDAVTTEKLRRCFAQGMKTAWRCKARSMALLVPEIPSLSHENIFRGISEGLLLANYAFDRLKADSLKKEPAHRVERILLIADEPGAQELAHKAQIISEGVHFARDLVNDNADRVTPAYLASVAKKFEKENSKIKTKIYDKSWLEKEGMGLLLAVGRASFNEPVLILASYAGNPKSKNHTILVGKGVTYDTGGLNLKPTGSMETMKSDMSGAAAVLATLLTAAKLGLKQNITAVVPSTENAIDSKSFKPGDVYTSYSGKTVEVDNTDAEGRLILADALAYSVKQLHPTRMIDVATLTGAISIALGNEAIGLFSNNDALADSLVRAGSETYERVWRMPLFEEYKEQLRSDIADIRNHGGRAAGSITAALFLQEFVDHIPWAHLDIAGTSYLTEAKRYNPRFATGVAVRLLIEFLERI